MVAVLTIIPNNKVADIDIKITALHSPFSNILVIFLDFLISLRDVVLSEPSIINVSSSTLIVADKSS